MFVPDTNDFETFHEQHGDKFNLALIRKIITEHGPPAYANEEGHLSKINEAFWAALRAAETYTIFAPEERRFYRYEITNKGLYDYLSDEAILKDFTERIFAASQSWPPQWAGLEFLRNVYSLKNIRELFRAETECKDAFRSKEYWQPLIACKNCLLRVDDSGKLRQEEFRPEFRLRHASPYAYDPKATCLKFKQKILSHIDEEDQLLLQKSAGLSLLGRNLYQRIVLLDGHAGSSKSAFVNILRGIVGPHACAELRTNLLTERFEIGAIARANLLFGTDVPGTFLRTKGAQRLKALVGDDLLECETKGSNVRQNITGSFFVFITSNETLHLRTAGDRQAWFRRLLRIHFDKPYNGAPIRNIVQELLYNEGSGILNFLLQGASMAYTEIQEKGDVSLGSKHAALVESLLNESDSLEIYLKDSIDRVGHGEGIGLTNDEIIAGYLERCRNESEVRTELPDLMSSLFGVIPSKNLERYGKKSCRGYRKVKMKHESEPSEEDWKHS
jgi:putative DNA primase/helicase